MKLSIQGLVAYHGDSLIGREIVPVILEDEQVQSYQTVGRVAGGEINLVIAESAREQAQVHDARGFEAKRAVGSSQPTVSVGSLHELVAESSAPLRSERGRLR